MAYANATTISILCQRFSSFSWSCAEAESRDEGPHATHPLNKKKTRFGPPTRSATATPCRLLLLAEESIVKSWSVRRERWLDERTGMRSLTKSSAGFVLFGSLVLLQVGDKFFGLAPLPKMRERIAIKEYASLHEGAKKLQGCFRQGTDTAGTQRNVSCKRHANVVARVVPQWVRRMAGTDAIPQSKQSQIYRFTSSGKARIHATSFRRSHYVRHRFASRASQGSLCQRRIRHRCSWVHLTAPSLVENLAPLR